MKIRLPARLFRAGDYPDKKYTADAATLDRIVAATRGAAGSPPMDLHHADTDETFDLGSVPAASVRREGDWILGDVEVEETDLPRFKSRGLSVKIDRATNAISKVTVTGSPRILGAGFSDDGGADEDALEFDGGYLMDPKDQAETTAEATTAAAPVIDETAVGNIVTRIMRKMFGGGEPAALMSADVNMDAMSDMEAKMAEMDAEMAQMRKDMEAMKKADAEMSDDRMQSEISGLILRGVPPVLADNLVPLKFGRSEIEFEADGKPATRSQAEAIDQVLAFAVGKLPQGNQLPRTTGDEAMEFDDRAAKTADAILFERLKTDPSFTRAEAQRLADDQLQRKEG